MSQLPKTKEFEGLSQYFEQEEQEYAALVDEALQREVVEGNLAPAAVVILAKATEESDSGSRMLILGGAAETLFLVEKNHVKQVFWALGMLQAARQQRLEEALITAHAEVELEGESLPETLEGLLVTNIISFSDSLTVPILVKTLRLAPSDQKILAFTECYKTLKMRGFITRLLRAVRLLLRYLFAEGKK